LRCWLAGPPGDQLCPDRGGFDIPLAWLNAAPMVPLLAVAWVAYRDLHVIRAGAADPPSRRLA
jgi:hypothetical protein